MSTHILFALVLATGQLPAQVSTVMSGIQSTLEQFVMILGPVVFLVGLVAHGLGNTHNSQNMSQWGSRAIKAGIGIFAGGLLLTVVFATFQSVL